jgi:hypothetical protein
MGNSTSESSKSKTEPTISLPEVIEQQKLRQELFFELDIPSPEAWLALAAKSSDRVFARTTMVKAVVQHFAPTFVGPSPFVHPPMVYFLNSEAYPTHLPFCSNICHLLSKKLPQNIICETNSFNLHNYKHYPRQFVLLSIVFYAELQVFGVELWPGDNLPPQALKETHELLKNRVYFGDKMKWRIASHLHETTFKQVPIPDFYDKMVLSDTDLFSGVNYQPLHGGLTFGICRIWKNSSMQLSALPSSSSAASSSETPIQLTQDSQSDGERLAIIETDATGAPKVDRRTILVCEELPIDLNPLRGLVTAQLQTPLCHVALLCTNRGTPNMALRTAMADFSQYDGKLIRLQIGHNDFDVKLATEQEEAEWKERVQSMRGERAVPVLKINTSVNELISLPDVQMPDDLLTTDPNLDRMTAVCDSIGSKALNLARFLTWDLRPTNNTGNKAAFVIPFHYFHQYVNEVAGAEISLLSSPETSEDDAVSLCGTIRSKILGGRIPENWNLLRAIEARLEGWRGKVKFDGPAGSGFVADGVIFRSSTNCEDLPGFPSAGLYESVPVEAKGPLKGESIEKAVLQVWASVFLSKAYLERREFSVSEKDVAMAVLVMPLLKSAVQMNGVAVTINPFRVDLGGCYLNVQKGTIAVTDACQGNAPEQIMFIRDGFKELTMEYLASSNLMPKGQHLITPLIADPLNRVLMGIHAGFRAFHTSESMTNAADVEFLILLNNEIVILQARPVKVQVRQR